MITNSTMGCFHFGNWDRLCAHAQLNLGQTTVQRSSGWHPQGPPHKVWKLKLPSCPSTNYLPLCGETDLHLEWEECLYHIKSFSWDLPSSSCIDLSIHLLSWWKVAGEGVGCLRVEQKQRSGPRRLYPHFPVHSGTEKSLSPATDRRSLDRPWVSFHSDY